MSVTYAGIPLPLATAEAAAWVEQRISLRDVCDPYAADWPGRYRGSWHPDPLFLPDRPLAPGTLFWPPGAAHFASAHFLVDGGTALEVRKFIIKHGYGAWPLAFDDDVNGAVTAGMYLLPPRPLAQLAWKYARGDVPASLEDLHLLTLVDERFFWWQKADEITVTELSTTWHGLITSILAALGVGRYNAFAVSGAYGKPSPFFTSRYELLPLLLDAVLVSVGLRLVRGLSGTVTLQTPDQAWDSQEAQKDGWPKQGGGVYDFSPFHETPARKDRPAGTSAQTYALDLDVAVPESVTVIFQKTVDGVQAAAVYPAVVPLEYLHGYHYLEDADGVARKRYLDGDGRFILGRPGDTKIIRTTAVAAFTGGGGTPANQSEVDAAAVQIALDFYKWQLGRLFVRYGGLVNYVPEGFHALEWATRQGDQGTRVQRFPFDYPDPVGMANSLPSGGVVIDAPVFFGGPVTFSSTVIVSGSTSYGSTSDVAVAPVGQLQIPRLTVAGPPTYTPVGLAEVLCDGKYFYQAHPTGGPPGKVWELVVPTGTGTPPTPTYIPVTDTNGRYGETANLTYDTGTNTLTVTGSDTAFKGGTVTVKTTGGVDIFKFDVTTSTLVGKNTGGVEIFKFDITNTAFIAKTPGGVEIVNLNTTTNTLTITNIGIVLKDPVGTTVGTLSLTTNNQLNLILTRPLTISDNPVTIAPGTNNDFPITLSGTGKLPLTGPLYPGDSAVPGTSPPGVISLPTLTTTGAPTWTPAAGLYPVEWNKADGTLYVWDGSVWQLVGTASAGGAAGGADGQLQFNNGGALDGAVGTDWDDANEILQLSLSASGFFGVTKTSGGVVYTAELCNSEAGYFHDDNGHTVNLCDGGQAANFQDGTNTADVCDGTYGVSANKINATAGYYAGGTAGASHTVPIPKVTGGGTDGSITFTNGIVTSYVDPT